jgi:uncharacterized protein YceH (UPF0502 family)
MKEARYAHLLAGPVESIQQPQSPAYAAGTAGPGADGAISPEQDGRIAQLEAAVAELRSEIAALRKKIEDLFA